MQMEFKPILPKKPILNAEAIHRALQQEMYKFATDMRKKIAKYPPNRPTKTGYRRTVALGRSWSASIKTTPAIIVGKVASDPTVMTSTPHTRKLKGGRDGKGPKKRIYYPKRSYAPYVVGKQQSRLMAGRGWKKYSDIFKGEWPGQVRRFQGIINRAK